MKELNEFFALEDGVNNHLYDISELDKEKIFMVVGNRNGSKTIYTPNTAEDYDYHFVHKLRKTQAADIHSFLTHHLSRYTENGKSAQRFIDHIRYAILPKMEKNPGYTLAIQDWVEMNLQSSHLLTLENGNTIQNIKKSISQGDIQGAMDELLMIDNAQLNNEILHLSGRYARLNQQKRKGIINDADAIIVENKISNDILGMVHLIEEK